MTPSIGIVIPTFQGAKHLPYCLPPLLQSSLNPSILIIDSSSSDETVSLAKSMGVEVLVIPQKEFNHGQTREKGRRLLATDIVVMVTQDAYATSPLMLERLVDPLIKKHASVSYARQLPHEDASLLASFPRYFNYPSYSHIRCLDDKEKFGAYTFFCSNSCAAYLNKALDEAGGFPSALFGEDTLVVAKLLQLNHRIAYVAEAQVRHSHDYSLKQEFCRHFDIGLVRRLSEELLCLGGADTKRGKAYAKALFGTLFKEKPSLIPYAVIQTAIKFLGYRMGQASSSAPVWFKSLLSSHPNYWKSTH